MKPANLLLVASIAANVALLTAFAVKPALAPPSIRDYFTRAESTVHNDASASSSVLPEAPARRPKKRSAAAAQARLWQDLHSADLPTLISRLRAAGFTPAVIRAIVNAELEKRFAARFDSLVDAADRPFWKADGPGMMGNTKFYEEMNQINRERTRLMRELLGDEFFASAGTDPTTAQRRRYGDIPKHKIDLVQRIADDYSEMISQVRNATQGIMLPEDREKLALLERERQADLAAILTPEELEEFEMRTSNIASRLRQTMTWMDASEDEFRTIFRVYQPLASVLFPTVGMAGSSAMDQRREAQQTAATQLREALGEQRYADFARANNSEYQQLRRTAQTENIPGDAVTRAFALRDTASTESNRIYDDQTLNVEQKRTALAALAEQTRAQAIAMLGEKAGDAYVKNTNWYRALTRGGAFTFGPDGNLTRSRGLPQPGGQQRQEPTPPPSAGVMILSR